MQASSEKEALVIDLSDVPCIDSSASFALDETIQSLAGLGNAVILFGLHPRMHEVFHKTGTLEKLSAEQLTDSRLDALHKASAALTNS